MVAQSTGQVCVLHAWCSASWGHITPPHCALSTTLRVRVRWPKPPQECVQDDHAFHAPTTQLTTSEACRHTTGGQALVGHDRVSINAGQGAPCQRAYVRTLRRRCLTE